MAVLTEWPCYNFDMKTVKKFFVSWSITLTDDAIFEVADDQEIETKIIERLSGAPFPMSGKIEHIQILTCERTENETNDPAVLAAQAQQKP